jgi:GT2 family glycosyltransferase
MNKVKIHTTEQPNSDTTTFILSCNRLQVLDETIESFLKTRDYVTKIVIVDDSAEQGVFETLVEKYGNFSDVICFPSNRSQWWAMDFMVSWCDTEYIFYLEDDWKLLQSGYLNASKQILRKYRDIGTVDISWRTFENEGIDSYDKTLIDGLRELERKVMTWFGQQPDLDIIYLKEFSDVNIDLLRKFSAV